MDCVCGVKLCISHRYSEFHYCAELKKKDEERAHEIMKDKIVKDKILERI